MADALARYGPTQPSNAGNTTLVTAGGAGTYTVVRQIHVANTTAATAWVTIGIGGVTAALAFMYQLPVDPGDVYDWVGNLPLLGSATTPDTLIATQQTAGALTVTIGAVTGP